MNTDTLKVLVADDEVFVRSVLKRYFSTRGGIAATIVEDGEKALAAAEHEDFDLYLLDMRMPGMDGLETFRAIRRIRPTAEVVFITGYAVDELIDAGLKEGVVNLLRKPFALAELGCLLACAEASKEARKVR